jgi:hypothetical protein
MEMHVRRGIHWNTASVTEVRAQTILSRNRDVFCCRHICSCLSACAITLIPPVVRAVGALPPDVHTVRCIVNTLSVEVVGSIETVITALKTARSRNSEDYKLNLEVTCVCICEHV